MSLEPGANYVTFTTEADESGLQQFTATVRMTGDAVAENDTHRAAVEVRGPPSVIIVEGEDGNGQILEDALAARGLELERVGLDDLPGVQELSVHRSLILVDVSERDLSESQVKNLTDRCKNDGCPNRNRADDSGTHLTILGGVE